MPKVAYPPQAGEKRLCLTLFCTMMMSVVCCVIIIYCIVIIYIPSKNVLTSNLTGKLNLIKHNLYLGLNCYTTLFQGLFQGLLQLTLNVLNFIETMMIEIDLNTLKSRNIVELFTLPNSPALS